MQTQLARAELVEHLKKCVEKENELVACGLWETVGEIAELATQALDALDSAKAIWRLANDGVETVEMENLE
jgi:hypothetical protein